MVVHENNRCYSYLSQMQNDANFCDINLYKVLFGLRWGGPCRGWCGVGCIIFIMEVKRVS